MPSDFFDTNVLVYSQTADQPPKNATAFDLLSRVRAARSGAVSIQVLQETYTVLLKEMPPQFCREVVEDLVASMDVYEPTKHDVLEAIDGSRRWQISFWDSMILLAARRMGATTVWSEDLNAGQVYEGVRVANPFRA